MSLLPFLNDQFDLHRPSRLLDQHFGLDLDEKDILSAFIPRRIRRALSCPYYRTWQSPRGRKDTGSTISSNNDAFQVSLDVQQFDPEEITVKATEDNTLTIEGKHEEKKDEHGSVSRHFIRKYTLPKGHDISRCVSKLSSDGVLTITAPKVEKDGQKSIDIPITVTNQPSRIEKIANGDGECCEDEEAKVEKQDGKKNKKK